MSGIWDLRARLYNLCEGSELRRGPHKAAEPPFRTSREDRNLAVHPTIGSATRRGDSGPARVREPAEDAGLPQEVDDMPTLLILDRERRSRRELYSLLVTRFEVVAVHGIFAAFRLLRRHRPDLVLVKTSGMDAFAMALLKWFQQQGLQIPTIVLVGHGAGHDANAVGQLGARAVLRWPVRHMELLRAITAADGHANPRDTDAAPLAHRKPAVLPVRAERIAAAGRNGPSVRVWRPTSRTRLSVLRRV